MSLPDAIGRLVARCCRNAGLVAVLGLAVGAASLAFVATHFAISTDTESLISQDVAWRRDASAFDRTFPGKSDQIVVVIDGRTADMAEAGASALAARLQARPDLFHAVARPAGGAFFDQHGLLFLPTAEVASTLDGLVKAQPLIGPLAADPSLRGVMSSLATGLGQTADGGVRLSTLDRPMAAIASEIEGALASRPAWMSWSSLIEGGDGAGDTRRILLLEPKLDYSRLMPGREATDETRAAAVALGLTPHKGVTVRITGPVPLDDEQLGSLEEGALPIAGAMLVAVVGVLWLALRSPKLIVAVLATVFAGLFVTAAAGLVAFGRFNLISVAFVALFVGLGIDFAIQFAVRFRAELAEGVEPTSAPAAAGRRVGLGLAIAAAATAGGFFAFSPTRYVGFSQLGVIAGIGMIVAFLLSVTLLPALITLLKPRGAAADAGFGPLAALGRAVAGRRRGIVAGFAVLSLLAAATLPLLRFDFDPVSLDSPRTESVSTLRDLARNPDTTLNTLDVVAPSAEAAKRLADRLAALPQVARAVTLTSFVPGDQPAKLALIADAANLLGPSLDPFDVAPPPTDAEIVASLGAAREELLRAADREPGAGGTQARRLAKAVAGLMAAGPAARARAQEGLIAGLPTLLKRTATLLTAAPVTLAALPPEIVRDWKAADGRVRVQVFPKGDANDEATIDRFVAAVQRVAPDAVGAPVAVRGSRTTILQAFAAAMGLSTAAIVVLLFAVLRRVRDVAMTLAPVAAAVLLTFATCVVFKIAINVENIVAVPLLVSVGAAFTIYFTLAWRQGAANLLDTSVARGVVFSALTTGLAFGSLWISPHPGTASLGALLIVSLGWTLICALGLQTALLGRPAILAKASPTPRIP